MNGTQMNGTQMNGTQMKDKPPFLRSCRDKRNHVFEMDWIDVGLERTERVYSCRGCHLIVTVDEWKRWLDNQKN